MDNKLQMLLSNITQVATLQKCHIMVAVQDAMANLTSAIQQLSDTQLHLF